jgi:transcriptional regulator with XRE-family HTH domain
VERPAPSFGALLRRLRLAREATIVREYHGQPRIETHTLSQQELARRAALDAAVVNRTEANLRHPTRGTVERLADALELGPEGRAALLVAAGYWPWPDLDQDRAAIVLAVALGVVAGDYRRLVPSDAHKNG